MVTIMLACNAGMSTSMLVNKMKIAAQDYADMDIDIFAVPTAAADKEVEEKQIDVLLLGPQVKFLLGEFKEKFEPKGIKVDVINMQDYGLMKGDRVLAAALALLE